MRLSELEEDHWHRELQRQQDLRSMSWPPSFSFSYLKRGRCGIPDGDA